MATLNSSHSWTYSVIKGRQKIHRWRMYAALFWSTEPVTGAGWIFKTLDVCFDLFILLQHVSHCDHFLFSQSEEKTSLQVWAWWKRRFDLRRAAPPFIPPAQFCELPCARHASEFFLSSKLSFKHFFCMICFQFRAQMSCGLVGGVFLMFPARLWTPKAWTKAFRMFY